MKNQITIQLLLFIAILILQSRNPIFSQNIGIGSTSFTPDPSAMFEVKATDKGMLVPRVDIADLSTAAPVTNPAVSLLVYNTNETTGEGFYYWDGNAWAPMGGGSASSEASCIILPTPNAPIGYSYTGYSQVFSGDGAWWRQRANYPRPRTYPRSVVYNNEIYIFGHKITSGSSSDNYRVYKYNPANNQWTELANMHGSMNYDLYRVEEVGGKFYFIAGIAGSTCGNAATWEYDPTTLTYTQKANMPQSRYNHATAVVNDKIYSFGGDGNCCGGCYNNNTYMYDVSNNTWTTRANLPIAMHGHTAISFNEKIYIFGGRLTGAITSNRVYEYNPATNTFSQKANMPAALIDPHALLYNNEIYVFGGTGVNSVQIYNPTDNTWRIGMNLPIGSSGIAGEVVGNKIYLIGLNSSQGAGNQTWEYAPDSDTGPIFYMHCKE